MGETVLVTRILYSYGICTKLRFIKPDYGEKRIQKGRDPTENSGKVEK